MKSRHRATLPWSYGILTKLPKKAVGVYAFWHRRSGKCVYVGMASAQPIKNRLRQHWNGSHNEALRLWMQAYQPVAEVCLAESPVQVAWR